MTTTTETTSPDPQLLYTDVDDELRASTRALLKARSDWTEVLARAEGDHPYDPKVWQGLAEIGVTGLAIPEELGGAGVGLREVSVVMEELGRFVAPTPFLGSAVLATTALLAAPAGTERDGLLGGLADGSLRAALAVPLSTAPGAAFPQAVRAADDVLTGTVTSVVDVLGADQLVVPAVGADGPGLYLVTVADVAVEPVLTLDLTRRIADVRLDGAAAVRLAGGDDAVAALEAALAAGAAMLAAEQLGVAERVLELTVEHLRTRYQFGRPLGSFQGLKHRVADLWVAVAQARAAVRYAADRVAIDDPDAAIAVSVAQAHCSPVALRAAEECVQMHGGLGFTWEHPAHLYLKRARSSAIALGTADQHRTRLASLVDLTL